MIFPRLVEEQKRFVLCWMDPTDMNILHRYVEKVSEMHLKPVSKRHSCFKSIFPLIFFKVLCKESIWNQRGYWEVEYSGWVAVGATFDEAARRANSELSGLGENEHSWGLCWSGSCYQIWFNCNHEDIKEVPFCSTIAMYIDQPAGIINFYIVPGEGTEKEVRLLHQVKTVIDKKILPGFWLGVQSSCTLLKKTD